MYFVLWMLLNVSIFCRTFDFSCQADVDIYREKIHKMIEEKRQRLIVNLNDLRRRKKDEMAFQ